MRVLDNFTQKREFKKKNIIIFSLFQHQRVSGREDRKTHLLFNVFTFTFSLRSPYLFPFNFIIIIIFSLFKPFQLQFPLNFWKSVLYRENMQKKKNPAQSPSIFRPSSRMRLALSMGRIPQMPVSPVIRHSVRNFLRVPCALVHFHILLLHRRIIIIISHFSLLFFFFKTNIFPSSIIYK